MMRSKKGFTLIELMIVVAIIGILAAIAIPMYTANVNKAKMQEAVDTIGAMKDEVCNYVSDRGNFPDLPEGSGNFTLNTHTRIRDALGIVVPGFNDVSRKWNYRAMPGGNGYQIRATANANAGSFWNTKWVEIEGEYDANLTVFNVWTWTAHPQVKSSWLPK